MEIKAPPAGADLGARFVAELEACLGKKLRWCPSGTDSGVYLQAYRLPAAAEHGGRILVHLVNYRVPIRVEKHSNEGAGAMWNVVTKSGAPEVQRNLKIAVPLPPNTRPGRVTPWSPTEPAERIEWSMKGDCAQIEVSKLKIYKAVVIELERDGERP